MARSSSALAVVQTPFEAAAARTRESIALRDLDIAPENLRAGEAPDDDIPVLADTLFAAGQLQPITVRPGRRREAPYMALDGRRRLLAFRFLVDQGRIEETFLVDVVVERDAARQAAAVVLTNTAVPVHVADVIAAIGRMVKSKLGVPVIARALGYAEVDVKRLAALSALPDVALHALRGGRLTLRQARLLVRLPDQDEQAELAQAALDGHGFADWRVTERLDRSQVSANDPRCALVSPDQYAAAGGRIEADLFGERAPILLDPSVLTDLWTARAGEIAQVFEAEGFAVRVTAGDPPDLPDDLEQAGYVYGGMLPADDMTAYREARSIQDAAADAVESALGDGSSAEALDLTLETMIRASLVVAQIAFGGRAATTLVFSPSRRTALQIAAWTPVVPAVDEGETGEPDDDGRSLYHPGAARFNPPQAEAPDPDVEGVGHSLHRLRTEVATRGLIRALADDPRTALTALIVRMFQVVASRGCHLRADSGLTITAQVFIPRGGQVIASLDGVVRERLDDRRAAWEASGQTLVRWVHGLDDEDRSALLADLVALTLDLTEARTDALRSTARAEACELAELSGADITRHWTPDADFLKPHSKPLLLAMLEAMGKAAPAGAAASKADLVLLVEATAAARGWAPAILSWAPPVGIVEGDPKGEAAGAFEITPEGQAALATAAE